MNSKIENSFKGKLNTLNKRRETQEKKSELLKETHRSKSEKQYQIKLKRLEKRRGDQYKNIVRKEKGKPPLVVKKKKDTLVEKIDTVFSKYIRRKYGPKCYTCDTGEGTTNGHRISRRYRAYRRSEDNCRPQCWYGCNCKTTGNGKPIIFEAKLKAEGINTEFMKSNCITINNKPSQQELKELLEYRERKYKKLLSSDN